MQLNGSHVLAHVSASVVMMPVRRPSNKFCRAGRLSSAQIYRLTAALAPPLVLPGCAGACIRLHRQVTTAR